MVDYLRHAFDALGADEIVVDEQVEGRPNLYAIFRSGHPDAKWLGVDVHMDTVGVSGAFQDLSFHDQHFQFNELGVAQSKTRSS